MRRHLPSGGYPLRSPFDGGARRRHRRQCSGNAERPVGCAALGSESRLRVVFIDLRRSKRIASERNADAATAVPVRREQGGGGGLLWDVGPSIRGSHNLAAILQRLRSWTRFEQRVCGGRPE